MVVGGCAVMDGCNNLLAAIRAAAHRTLRLSQRRDRDRRWRGERPAASARAFRISPASKSEGSFATTIRTYSYGAHACHVAVDPRTGHVDILDYVAIEDVGVAINPHIVHGQAIGALVQGLGGVFLDQIIYDADAQMLNASLADYLVPLATDFSNVRAITMELRRSKTNPLGAKGAGEGGMVAVAATARRMRWRRRLSRSASRCAICRCRRRDMWKLVNGDGVGGASSRKE